MGWSKSLLDSLHLFLLGPVIDNSFCNLLSGTELYDSSPFWPLNSILVRFPFTVFSQL